MKINNSQVISYVYKMRLYYVLDANLSFFLLLLALLWCLFIITKEMERLEIKKLCVIIRRRKKWNWNEEKKKQQIVHRERPFLRRVFWHSLTKYTVTVILWFFIMMKQKAFSTISYVMMYCEAAGEACVCMWFTGCKIEIENGYSFSRKFRFQFTVTLVDKHNKFMYTHTHTQWMMECLRWWNVSHTYILCIHKWFEWMSLAAEHLRWI